MIYNARYVHMYTCVNHSSCGYNNIFKIQKAVNITYSVIIIYKHQ